MNKFSLYVLIFITISASTAFIFFTRITNIITSKNVELGLDPEYSQQQSDNKKDPCGPIWISLAEASSTGNFNEPYAVDTNGIVHYSPNDSVDVITKSTENEFYILDESSCHGVIYPTLGKSLNTVYDYGYPIPLADAPSFMPVLNSDGAYSSYFRDKERVYTYLPEFDDSGKHTGGVIFTSMPYADSGSFQINSNNDDSYDALDSNNKYKLGHIVTDL